LLEDNIEFPTHIKLTAYRKTIHLLDQIEELHLKPYGLVGVYVQYPRIVHKTLVNLLDHLEIKEVHYPLSVNIADGLDGAGSHKIYKQMQLSGKHDVDHFLLFVFKIISIVGRDNNKIFENPLPNSPFCHRPVALLALDESLHHVKLLFDDVINPGTDILKRNGILIKPRCAISIHIDRVLFDGKMYKGVVLSYNEKTQWYRVMYQDGDHADYTFDEILKLKFNNFSRKKNVGARGPENAHVSMKINKHKKRKKISQLL